MSFKLSHRSAKQLNKFARTLLNNREGIERNGKRGFIVWGDDKILGTPSAISVEANKRGNIETLISWTSGQDQRSSYDDQFFALEVDNPSQTIDWFSRQLAKDSSGLIYADMTNPQPWADAINDRVPGLEGGQMDVYVSFGDYSAFA